MDYGKLGTEQLNARSSQLDTMSAYDIVSLMNELDMGAITAVKAALNEIGKTAEAAAEAITRGGRLIYLGAGTSGRLGVLDASECPPTFGVNDNVVIGIIAGGDGALRKAVEGAEDSEALAQEDLTKLNVNKNDVVVAISASGTAPYCIGALKAAKQVGALAVAMCCNTGARLSEFADVAIEMPTGAEVLSGSTRLRAGTATKLALNMISTAAMVRVGKVYKNLMVDVCTSNIKLKDRAVRIAMKAMDIERSEAEERLKAAGGNIKAAIVMKETGCDKEKAEAALSENKGFVRKTIESLK